MRWWLFPVLAAVACGGFLLSPPGAVSETIYVGIAASSLAAVLVGIRVNRPTTRAAWSLIAAGSALWLLGDVAYLSIALTREAVPMLSVADVIYLLGYPLLAVGLYRLAHRGGRAGELGHVANSTIVMIAFGLLLWVFVVQPESVGSDRTAGIVGVAYPAMDVFLFGLLVQSFGSKPWQLISFRLLAVAMLATLAADLVLDVAAQTVGTNPAGTVGLGYLAYYVLVGTAALHPSMRRMSAPRRRRRATVPAASFGTPTLVVLSAAILAVPASMAVLLARGEDVTEWGWGVVLCSILLVGLVFVRVTELLQLLGQQTRSLRGVAETDHLTGMPNRNGLERWVDDRTDDARPLTILLLDIDRFKDINDTFGHGVGDDVLRAVGRRLRDAVGERGAVGRVGADEFAVVTDVGLQPATVIADDMHSSLADPVVVHGATLAVEASIGIACSTDSLPGTPPETVGRHAYLAMSSAKVLQPRIAVYEPSMDRDESGPLLLLSGLTSAMERHELEVYYQVQVSLETMNVVGVEALLRWNHPERGLIEPDSFLPMVERTALIGPLLAYVLTEALTQQQKWSKDGLELTVSVNISARNLLDPTVVEQVRRTLDIVGAPAEVLTIEITETASMTDLPVAVESLTRMRSLGVNLAIDDYGTGYSTLTYLQRLPVQQIKIDRAFVTDMSTTVVHEVIVRSTIDLARTLGLVITAEGVEDRETLMKLKELSCHRAQGYYLGRPVPASDIPESVTALNAELRDYIEVT